MPETPGKPPIDHAFRSATLKGGADDPTFAGALSFMRRRYSRDLTGVDLAILGIPLDVTVTNRPGARFGPQAIRRASAILDGDPQYPVRLRHLSRSSRRSTTATSRSTCIIR